MPKSKVRKKKETSGGARTKYRVTINADVEKNRVKITFLPRIANAKLDEMHRLLNVLQVGTTAGFHKILAPLPMLRPATEEEREMQIYVMKSDKDVALYKQRKVMYENLVQEFDTLVEELFGDVRYVDMCTKRQEEIAFELEGDEFENYKMEVEAVTQLVKGDLEDDRIDESNDETVDGGKTSTGSDRSSGSKVA